MDYTAAAIQLALLLFVQPNATATADTLDLTALAQTIDQALPAGTADGSSYVPGIQASLSGSLASLSAQQVADAVACVIALRNAETGG